MLLFSPDLQISNNLVLKLVEGKILIMEFIRAPPALAIYVLARSYKGSILLNIMFHAPMGRFQLELIYYLNPNSLNMSLTKDMK